MRQTSTRGAGGSRKCRSRRNGRRAASVRATRGHRARRPASVAQRWPSGGVAACAEPGEGPPCHLAGSPSASLRAARCTGCTHRMPCRSSGRAARAPRRRSACTCARCSTALRAPRPGGAYRPHSSVCRMRRHRGRGGARAPSAALAAHPSTAGLFEGRRSAVGLRRPIHGRSPGSTRTCWAGRSPRSEHPRRHETVLDGRPDASREWWTTLTVRGSMSGPASGGAWSEGGPGAGTSCRPRGGARQLRRRSAAGPSPAIGWCRRW